MPSLAAIALILGITSIVLVAYGFFTGTEAVVGIAAIIIGHIAMHRAKRLGNRGMALTGLILGYASILLWLFVLLALPRRISTSPSITCVSHLKQATLAARLWAEDHQGQFPTHWVSFTEQLPAPKALVCPSDEHHKPAKSWDRFTAENVTYEMVTPGAAVAPETNVFLRCPIHGHEAMVDGSVIQRAATKSAP